MSHLHPLLNTHTWQGHSTIFFFFFAALMLTLTTGIWNVRLVRVLNKLRSYPKKVDQYREYDFTWNCCGSVLSLTFSGLLGLSGVHSKGPGKQHSKWNLSQSAPQATVSLLQMFNTLTASDFYNLLQHKHAHINTQVSWYPTCKNIYVLNGPFQKDLRHFQKQLFLFFLPERRNSQKSEVLTCTRTLSQNPFQS